MQGKIDHMFDNSSRRLRRLRGGSILAYGRDKDIPTDDVDNAIIQLMKLGKFKHKVTLGCYANLVDHQTEVYFDGECIATQKSESLRDYVENQLTELNFDELVSVPSWVIEELTKTGIHNPDLQYM